MLTNEKYIGNNVYNRESSKLKVEKRINLPSEWIRRDGAYQALVATERFRQAQAIIAARSAQIGDAEMLSLLRDAFDRHGELSGVIIDECDDMPSSGAYGNRFGGLLRAYELVGFHPQRDYAYLEINRALRARFPAFVENVSKGVGDAVGHVETDPQTQLLFVNRELTVSIVIARCKQLDNGHRQWRIRLDTSLEPDVTVIVRMNADNTSVSDYYVLPAIDGATSSSPTVAAHRQR